MVESNLSRPNEIPQLVLQHETYPDQFPTLPPELILVIIQLLSCDGQQKKVKFSRRVGHQIERFSKARDDVKAAIKELVLDGRHSTPLALESILFPFLIGLPNLQKFRWKNSHHFLRCKQGFQQLVASLQHCPLEHFAYWAPFHPEKPVTAPPRLKSLSVKFHHAHVYDLIRPSFSTLVELELYTDSVKIDLLPLKPVGKTLRKFAYQVDGFDPDILDTIPDVSPGLTTLELGVQNTTQSWRWKNSYDDAIAKNTKLQYLAVTSERFRFCDRNPQPHFDCKKCGIQRVEATRALGMACTSLKCCSWNPGYAQYYFNVRLSRKSSNLVRIKRVPVTHRYVPGPFACFDEPLFDEP